MTIFVQKAIVLLCLLNLLLPLLSSCRSSQLSRESRPRSGQLHWGDEMVLQSAVRRLLDSSRLASREPGIAKCYADLLRFWYQASSGNGQDVDGGVRMLNYLRQIHFQNGGSRALWKEAVRAAKEAGRSEDGLPALPIPSKFK